MVQPGMINLDFSDIKTVMSEMGKAMMGTGEASGEGRAVAAAEAAIANPLIDDVSLKGAKGLIINITGGKDITLYEVDEAANRIKQEVDEEANIIYGTTCDDRLDGLVRVSIVATGIDSNTSINAKPLENFAPIKINNDIYKSDETNQEQQTEAPALIIEQTNPILEENNNSDFSQEKMLSEKNNENTEVKDEKISEINHSLDEVSFTNLNTSNSSDDEIDLIGNKYENSSTSISNSNIDNIQIEDDIEDEIEDDIIISNKSETTIQNISEEKNIDETSVRRLSLFDNISPTHSEISVEEKQKTEPVISENTIEIPEVEQMDSIEISEENESEFNASNEELNAEFNQETEEELLDIPTFLRRQAN
jgi:cell division protein FtsZ